MICNNECFSRPCLPSKYPYQTSTQIQELKEERFWGLETKYPQSWTIWTRATTAYCYRFFHRTFSARWVWLLQKCQQFELFQMFLLCYWNTRQALCSLLSLVLKSWSNIQVFCSFGRELTLRRWFFVITVWLWSSCRKLFRAFSVFPLLFLRCQERNWPYFENQSHGGSMCRILPTTFCIR